MPDRLDAYRAKRSFDETPEPAGAPGDPGAALRFVIHEHHATRLHWDLRLEHEGVLASWAVPNGIPDDPKQNRKAIHVEDHPIEYLDFRGVIPEGNYGAGRITVWDEGTFTLEKWRTDEVILTFHGERLRGKYALFQAGKTGKDWLLHRMSPREDPDAELIPERIEPMFATLAELPGQPDDWAFEVKWDGVRALARSEPGRWHLVGRSGREITKSYPELYVMNRALSSHSAILDGELIAFDEDGRQSFQAVQHRIHQSGPTAIKRLSQESPVTFMVFDLLWLDGHSLVDLPYEERRARLDELGLAQGEHWDVPAYHVGVGAALLEATREQGLEGIVAKRLGSVYEPGARARSWRKIKNSLRQEVVIGGTTPGTGGRSRTFGAIQTGVFDASGDLVYTGGVGSGFSEAALAEVLKALDGQAQSESPFVGRQPPKGTRFVEPTLVAEVSFGEWSRDGSLRHPVFRGLRFDKDAGEVVREEAAQAQAADHEDAEPVTATGEESQAEVEPETSPKRTRRPKARAPEGRTTDELVIDGPSLSSDGHDIKVTNLDKVLYPETGTTKREVIAYYAAIAPVLVPHLMDRPVTLKRYPDGVAAKSFFEKHANRYRPDWVETVTMDASSKGDIDFVAVQNRATLLWTANLAAIELHPSLSRAPEISRPTALVFDLDPGEPATIVECCRVAVLIRDLLDQLDLACWAKTSGSKGLQLYAPINVDVTYDDTKPFAQAVAALLEQREPDLVVSRQTKTLRPGKVLIDWSQNDRHKTTVSVYSMRARDTPTVSTPVTWDEVEGCAAGDDPTVLRFTKDDVLARVARDGDLFAPLLTLQQALPALGGGR